MRSSYNSKIVELQIAKSKHLKGHSGPRMRHVFPSEYQTGAKIILAYGKIILAGGKLFWQVGKLFWGNTKQPEEKSY